jgi:hypothetical protein
VEDDAAHVTILEGFMVPKPEILPIPKQAAELDRAGTVKGFKDRLDILASSCMLISIGITTRP